MDLIVGNLIFFEFVLQPMANWSELLPELLVEIAKSITVYGDLISFGNVRQSWASAAQTIRSTFTAPSRFPSLMLAEDNEDNGNFRRFYVLSNRVTQKIEFPEVSKKQCFSSRGWLLTVGDNDTDVKLVEPFTRTQLDLPKLDTLPDYYDNHRANIGFPSIIFKMSISSQPSSDLNNFFVFILYGTRNQLAFCKPGHASWTVTTEEWRRSFYDFTYHNGRLYLVDYGGQVMVSDIHGLNLTNFVCIAGNPPEFTVGRGYNDIEWLYILGYDDNKLFVVSREGYEPEEPEYDKEDPEYSTKSFRVFELDLKDCKWTKLETLGDRAVFVGLNSGFSTEASEDGIIKANCIYFTDDRYEVYFSSCPKGGGIDMGIYRLCDGSIEPYFSEESRSLLTPPIWIEPSS